MKRLSLIYIAITLLCLANTAIAQRTINGIVVDCETEEPLIGANIIVKGTSTGTVADLDGKFQLNVPSDASTLVISYVGYPTFEVELSTQTYYRVEIGVCNRIIESTAVGCWGNPRRLIPVNVRGTTRATLTSLDGSFSIQADEGETLVFRDIINGTITEKPVTADDFPEQVLVPEIGPNEDLVVTRIDDYTTTPISGTLRWAVEAANAGCGNGRIIFNIPGLEAHTIRLQSSLTLLDSITIDGTTQPGYSPEDWKIIIAGESNVDTLLRVQYINCIVTGLHFKDYKIGLHALGFSSKDRSDLNITKIHDNLFEITRDESISAVLSNSNVNFFLNKISGRNLAVNEFNVIGILTYLTFTQTQTRNPPSIFIYENELLRVTTGMILYSSHPGGNFVENNIIEGSFSSGTEMGRDFQSGILIGGSGYVAIKENSIERFPIGIYIYGGNLNISNNKIHDNFYGILSFALLSNQDIRASKFLYNDIYRNNIGVLLANVAFEETNFNENLIYQNKKGLILRNARKVKVEQNRFFSKDLLTNDTSLLIIENSKENLIFQNKFLTDKEGIIISNSESDHISQNLFTPNNSNSGKPIDLLLNSSAPGNLSKPKPSISSAEWLPEMSGIRIKGRSAISDKIEVFQSNGTPNTVTRYLATTITDNNGDWVVEIPSSGFGESAICEYVYLAATATYKENTSEYTFESLTINDGDLDDLAAFEFDNCNGLTVSFNGQFSSDEGRLEHYLYINNQQVYTSTEGLDYEHTFPNYGTYQVRHEIVSLDQSHCRVTQQRNVIVFAQPELDFELSGDCSQASIIYTGSQLNPNWSYTWSWLQLNGNASGNASGQGTPQRVSLANFAPGEYTFKLTISAYGCSYSIKKAFTVVDFLRITASTGDMQCADEPDGSISIVPEGGIPPYSVSVNGLPAAFELNDLTAGVYNVSVSDARGCQVMERVIVLDNSPFVEVHCVSNGACEGLVDVSIEFTTKRRRQLSWLTRYKYEIVNENNQVLARGRSRFDQRETVTLQNVQAGQNIRIHVLKTRNSFWWRGNDCEVWSAPISIEPPQITFRARPQEGEVKCFNDQPIRIDLTFGASGTQCTNLPQDDFVYQLQQRSGAGFINVGEPRRVSAGTVAFPDVLPLTYYRIEVIYDQNGYNCVRYFDINLPALNPDIQTTLATSDVFCTGSQERKGIASVTVTGGAQVYFDWYRAGTTTPFRSGRNLYELTNLDAGDYFVIVSERPQDGSVRSECVQANFDYPTHAFSIREVPTCPKPVITANSEQCQLSAIIPDVGEGPYRFHWAKLGLSGTTVESIENFFTETVTVPVNGSFISIPNINPEPGTYVVAVTDANGCTNISDAEELEQASFERRYEICIRWNSKEIDVPATPSVTEPNTNYIATQASNVKNQIAQATERCIQRYVAEEMEVVDGFCTQPESVEDELSITYEQEIDHYTLYYYDQGDNLIQTIPPAGVELTASTVAPSQHRMATNYQYNSLGQLTEQSTPDAGTTRFIYNDLSQLRFSQNARQADPDDRINEIKNNPENATRYSYTKYDELGRMIEAGESILAANTDFTNLAAEVADVNFPQINTSEVTRTYYNNPADVDYFGAPQRYLDNRISYTTKDNLFGGTVTSFYSYDAHGNLEWLSHELPDFGRNYIGYDYDLISGNVLQVKYNEGYIDRFFHRYHYDEDNRMTQVETSRDSVIWETDIRYSYYDHGPMRHSIIGHDSLQKVDYTYTIHGWLKAINRPDLIEENPRFGNDLFGQSLGFYPADFERSGNPLGLSINQATHHERPLFNGNISAWTSRTEGIVEGIFANQPTFQTFQYDYLDRLRSSQFNLLRNGGLEVVFDFYSQYSYDGNGNILNLQRRGMENSLMDDFSYNYPANDNAQIVSNQLYQVVDAISDDPYSHDLESGQTNQNYQYDASGNLVLDQQADLEYFWDIQGKLSEVRSSANATEMRNTQFQYDAMGNRMIKEQILNDSTRSNTYYSKDNAGNIHSIYERSGEHSHFQEYPLYGNTRLGTTIFSGLIFTDGHERQYREANLFVRQSYDKVYELNDHIGNVRVLFKDSLINNSNLLKADFYSSYYPFGMKIKDLSSNKFNFRFGFNGMEEEKEDVYTTLFRIYDSRIAAWSTIDPLISETPERSPYLFVGLNPILAVDDYGLSETVYTRKLDRDLGSGLESKETGTARRVIVLPPIYLDVGDYKGDNAMWERGKFIGFTTLHDKYGVKVSEHTLDALNSMISAANEDGIEIRLNSAFRTYKKQASLYSRYKAGKGNLAAKPGFSNHQNGIAFDIARTRTGKVPESHKRKNKAGKLVPYKGFGRGETYEWLSENATKYGFVRTVRSESWHWEYRPKLAERLRDQGEYRRWKRKQPKKE
ncbi:MAG: carboxypeptidase-like regulatory domain-containing protein [Chitinophagales bacterium]|nr:carboxypeptidase-like regulatory domain-containing protein [Chitinophagales bacterium]